ncbi:MAG TPA: single-stranded-DNA-specific exonuclease RecJ [Polyangiales bacterium]|nr:single-stranded-DNA-specific exonuclease RecJ [Polyangiales bacterium]
MHYAVKPCDPLAARELGKALELAPALAQVLLHRGFSDTAQAREFLSPQLAGLSAPDAMLDRSRAADRLARAIRRRERIAIFGDYDVDGTTSCAILAGILEQLGGVVHASVGNRWEGGYGLSDIALDRVLESSPSVLVTCDCGSSDHERIARAMKLGIDVIVVDHHLVPEQELPAFAFLNPHRPECGYEYKGLASAGLVLVLGAAVRAVLGVKLDLRDWLDLVALGTIADVAPLDGDNRRLVRAGLSRLASDSARPGIVALRELARVRTRGSNQTSRAISAVDVAFRMTPRLNAAGRMGDPAITLALLRSREVTQARQLAARIEQLNDERKAIERHTTDRAYAQVLDCYSAAPSCGVVLAGPDFHRGVVGISAARVVDRFGVPAIVIAVDGEHAHGSARAPDGFPLFDAIQRCASVLERFGGHHAAAGVTLRSDRIEQFRELFAQATRDLARESFESPTPIADVALDPSVFELPAPGDLVRLEPMGQANAEPVFLLPEARVVECGVVKDAHLKLMLRIGSRSISAFGYDMGERREGRECPFEPGSLVHVLGHLRIDNWNGREEVELRLVAPPQTA